MRRKGRVTTLILWRGQDILTLNELKVQAPREFMKVRREKVPGTFSMTIADFFQRAIDREYKI
jgi:hypothetical protein